MKLGEQLVQHLQAFATLVSCSTLFNQDCSKHKFGPLNASKPETSRRVAYFCWGCRLALCRQCAKSDQATADLLCPECYKPCMQVHQYERRPMLQVHRLPPFISGQDVALHTCNGKPGHRLYPKVKPIDRSPTAEQVMQLTQLIMQGDHHCQTSDPNHPFCSLACKLLRELATAAVSNMSESLNNALGDSRLAGSAMAVLRPPQLSPALQPKTPLVKRWPSQCLQKSANKQTKASPESASTRTAFGPSTAKTACANHPHGGAQTTAQPCIPRHSSKRPSILTPRAAAARSFPDLNAYHEPPKRTERKRKQQFTPSDGLAGYAVRAAPDDIQNSGKRLRGATSAPDEAEESAGPPPRPAAPLRRRRKQLTPRSTLV